MYLLLGKGTKTGGGFPAGFFFFPPTILKPQTGGKQILLKIIAIYWMIKIYSVSL
jgi:hypothetical protein